MTRLKAMQVGAMAAGASFLVTTLVVWALTQGQGGKTPGPPQPVTSADASRPPVAAPNTPLASADLRVTNDVRVYQMVQESVVNISATKIVNQLVSSGNPLFDQLAGPQLRSVQAQSLGSGFVIHSAGYVITNEHVVEDGKDIQCVFSNGEKLPAKVVATDNAHDLAVLKIDSKRPLKAVVLGASEDLMIGEPVYAIGNPFGFSGTMTRGIVSAVDRTLDVSKERSYTGLIQTDASINPGNSGGPLLNAYGQVVGINTAIKQGAMGIGFAISVSNMRDLLPTFLNPETLNLAERAEIGFALEEKRESRRPATVVASVLVKQVQEGSAAEKAGLKAGDQLVAVGGTKVFNVADALVDLAGTKPGETLALNVLRGREPVSLKFPVTKAPLPPVEDLLLTKMGIKAETVTPALVEQYKLIFNQGVYIREVVPNSPAAVSGILPGDALIQLGRFRVASTEDVATLLKLFKPPVDWSVIIIRGDKRGDGIVHLK